MKIKGLRGATTLENNSEDELKNATVELLNLLLRENELDIDDIIYTQFSLTKDVNCAYPAKFARKFCGFEKVPMMCVQEQDVLNSLPLCLRVLILFETEKAEESLKHAYLKKAKVLRPDLI